MRLKLRQQLIASYLPLLLIPILVIGLITRGVAERGLNVLVTQQGERQAGALVPRFEDYYQEHGSWEGVNELFVNIVLPQNPPGQNPNGNRPNGPPPFQNPARQGQSGEDNDLQPQGEQVILTDTKGLVLAANTPLIVGRTLPAETVARGVTIFVDEKAVGVLIVGGALGVLDKAQKELLDTVNMAVLVAGLISAAVTMGFGLWFSGQISAPVAALNRGVRGLASGQWSKPIPVYAQNELGELTQAFNTMADDLVRQQNIRKQLMADIAHDLRTPLSVLTLEIEGIKAGFQTPAEAAQSLQDEVEWLSHLVDDLHTLSLIDAGGLSIQPEPTDTKIFLESVSKHWRTAAEQQKRLLTFTLGTPLPIVTIDPPRMRQVLGNLIQNAIQHTPPNASITLRAEASGGQVFIRVTDTGQGIPAEALPHLFERFYRVDKSRNRSTSSGSGLGLSIAYQLTALQNGKLSVESQPGVGTTFTIQLPAAV